MSLSESLAAAARVLRRRGLLFVALHLVAGLIVALVLGPLLSTLLGWLVLVSGDAALTDQDILYAVLSPVGSVLLLVGLGLWLTVTVFETSAMLLAVDRIESGHRPRLGALLAAVLLRFRALFRLAIEMAWRVLLLAAPFLAVAGYAYLHFLTEYDINYYLAERPPEFRTAALVIGAALGVLAVLLLRLLAGWFLALPLVLIGAASGGEALRESRARLAGRRRAVLVFLLGWALLFGGLLVASGALLQAAAEWLVGGALQRSLVTLAWMAGGLVLAWSTVNFFVSLFASVSFVSGVRVAYRRCAPVDGSAAALQKSAGTGSAPGAGLLPALLVGLLLVGGVQLLVLGQQLEEFRRNERPDIMAHRGASFDAPENTLAAIELAIEQGADWVEIDVQETRDGRVLVIHDRDLMKIAGSPLRVYDAPFDALRAVDIGSWKAPRFADQRVPLLSEVLEAARGRIKLNIELKYYGREERLEERVAELVEAHGMADDVVLMSLSLPGVRAMKALRPEWTVGLLSSVAVGDVTRLDADFFAINARFASREFVQRAQRRGKGVLTWTVNDPAGMSAMIGKGVDAIITDRPALAQRVWEERAALAVHERLLVQFASTLGSDYDEGP